MTVESTTQALCDLALRFGEGDEESMVSLFQVSYIYLDFFQRIVAISESRNPQVCEMWY